MARSAAAGAEGAAEGAAEGVAEGAGEAAEGGVARGGTGGARADDAQLEPLLAPPSAACRVCDGAASSSSSSMTLPLQAVGAPDSPGAEAELAPSEDTSSLATRLLSGQPSDQRD